MKGLNNGALDLLEQRKKEGIKIILTFYKNTDKMREITYINDQISDEIREYLFKRFPNMIEFMNKKD